MAWRVRVRNPFSRLHTAPVRQPKSLHVTADRGPTALQQRALAFSARPRPRPGLRARSPAHASRSADYYSLCSGRKFTRTARMGLL